jgi:DNA polymerase-3 subunit beta
MKLTCDRKKLLHVAQAAASIVPGRSAKPILQYLKLEAGPLPSGKDGLTILATDLEVSLRITLDDCTIDEPGAVAVPAARFTGLLQSGTGDEVALTCSNDKVGMRMGGSKFILPTVNADEFPAVSKFSEENSCYRVSAAGMATAIRRTSFAADPDSTRYQLGGVLFEVERDELHAVAMDGRRLAAQTMPLARQGDPDGPSSGVLMQKGLQLLTKICGDAGEETEVAFTVTHSGTLFQCGNATCYIRHLEGRFPNWRDIVSRNAEGTGYARAVVKTEDLHAAIRQVLLIVTEDKRGAALTLDRGKIVLKADTDLGKTEITVLVCFEDVPRVVALDPRFIAEFCRVLKEENFEMFVKDSECGVMFRSAESNYRYMAMPLSC